MDNDDLMRAVGTELRMRTGCSVTLEYPGFLLMATSTGPQPWWWSIGTANRDWGGDLHDAAGEARGHFHVCDSAAWRDPARIAAAILLQIKARDVIARALVVIQESDGADEHAELIGELRALLLGVC